MKHAIVYISLASCLLFSAVSGQVIRVPVGESFFLYHKPSEAARTGNGCKLGYDVCHFGRLSILYPPFYTEKDSFYFLASSAQFYNDTIINIYQLYAITGPCGGGSSECYGWHEDTYHQIESYYDTTIKIARRSPATVKFEIDSDWYKDIAFNHFQIFNNRPDTLYCDSIRIGIDSASQIQVTAYDTLFTQPILPFSNAPVNLKYLSKAAIFHDTTSFTGRIKFYTRNSTTDSTIEIPIHFQFEYKPEESVPFRERSAATLRVVVHNATKSVIFTLANTSRVVIEEYDILGRRIEMLANNTFSPGQYELVLKIHPGISFVRMEVDGTVLTKKVRD